MQSYGTAPPRIGAIAPGTKREQRPKPVGILARAMQRQKPHENRKR